MCGACAKKQEAIYYTCMSHLSRTHHTYVWICVCVETMCGGDCVYICICILTHRRARVVHNMCEMMGTEIYYHKEPRAHRAQTYIAYSCAQSAHICIQYQLERDWASCEWNDDGCARWGKEFSHARRVRVRTRTRVSRLASGANCARASRVHIIIFDMNYGLARRWCTTRVRRARDRAARMRGALFLGLNRVARHRASVCVCIFPCGVFWVPDIFYSCFFVMN